MTITHEFKMDLTRPRAAALMEAVQGDACTRQIRLSLTAENRPWTVPADTRALVRYRRPDGAEGMYDTLPDGSDAVTLDGSAVTVALSPAVLTVPGRGKLSVTLYRVGQEVTTWAVELLIHHNYGSPVTADGSYQGISGMLPAPESGEAGQHLIVGSVDSNGKVTSVQTVDAIDGLVQTADGMVFLASGGKPVGSGLYLAAGGGSCDCGTALGIVRDLLAKAVYTEDVSDLMTGLDTALGNGETEVTLTGITAAYSGGEVAVGTALSELTGITVIASYSDGSTDYVTGYTLSGTIAEGDNVITVSYGGKTAAFTVTGAAEGEVAPPAEPDPEVFPVANNLTNATTSNSAVEVTEGNAYLATITADSGYELTAVTVKMGGVNVTSSVYSNGVINIPSVTGNIAITAVASEVSKETVEEVLTRTLINETYPNLTTFAYTAKTDTTAVASYKTDVTFEPSTLGGGTLEVEMDTAELALLKFLIFVFDSEGNPYQMMDDQFEISGELVDPAMVAAGVTPGWSTAVGSFTFPIPDGCNVMLHARMQTLADTTTYASGSAMADAVIAGEVLRVKVVKEV